MRIALGQIAAPDDDLLLFARQLGLRGIQFNTPRLPGERRWEYEDLLALRERCEGYGLQVEAIENLPHAFYERCMLGLAGREQELEHVRATIRNMGRAGIRVLGFHFMPGSVWRTSLAAEGRGGARVSAFDLEVAMDPGRASDIFIARRDRRLLENESFVQDAHFAVGSELDDDAMWSNFRYFVEGVLPAAEDAGVRLALHPDDPPVALLGGIARIFRSVEALKRAVEIADSPAFGMELCLGTISEMGGEAAVMDAITSFGPEGKIVYVHFRDVQGLVPRFQEAFLGEGNYNPLRVMRTLKRVGFTGFILDDHVPRMIDDTEYAHRGRAHAIGYLQALLSAVEDEARQGSPPVHPHIRDQHHAGEDDAQTGKGAGARGLVQEDRPPEHAEDRDK
jgi:mannonate dehydratase